MTAPTTDTRQDMLDKVRKMFAKAASVAGTPEAEAFNTKAYELLAKYGIDEAEARQRREEGPAPIRTRLVSYKGSYIKQQRSLIFHIADALRCEVVYHRDTEETELFGTETDLDRVYLLFSALLPQMIAGANKIRSYDRPSTTVSRRSFMYGFIEHVGERLASAEAEAVQDAAPGTALVLIDDAARALAAKSAKYPNLRKARASRVQYDPFAAGAGRRAASRLDLGQTGIRGQRALGR